MTQSSTILCLIVGVVKLQIFGKNSQVHLIIIKEWPKSPPPPPPPPILRNLDNFYSWCILFDPPTIKYKRVTSFNEYTPAPKEISQLVTKLTVMISLYCSWCSEKNSKFEIIHGYNCCFMIQKGLFNERTATTFQRSTLPLKNFDSYKRPLEIMTVPLKMYGWKSSFEIAIRLK